MVELKINRHTYQISESDVFTDNGKCIQLLTQSHEKGNWGRRPHPVLPKRCRDQIAKYERVMLEDSKTCFTLRLNRGRPPCHEDF